MRCGEYDIASPIVTRCLWLEDVLTVLYNRQEPKLSRLSRQVKSSQVKSNSQSLRVVLYYTHTHITTTKTDN